jgi:glycosyltransferase involved in cell wall biosynthesis
MAAGLPVVATRVDGLVEQVDGSTGVLVAPGDARGLREAILALIDAPARRAAMAQAAVARVRTRFTLERHADELELAYRRALAAASRRRSPVP